MPHKRAESEPGVTPATTAGVGPIQAAPARFWRILFWLVVIHFGLFAFLAAFVARDYQPAVPVFHETWFDGALKVAALWLVMNTGSVTIGFVAADVPALYLIWRLAHRSAKKSHVAIYLCCTLGAHAANVAAVVYVTRVGTFPTSQKIQVFDKQLLFPLVLSNVILASPAWIMLVGIVVLGWPRNRPGYCRVCGYDLRASPDRCPECGTAYGSTTALQGVRDKRRRL